MSARAIVYRGIKYVAIADMHGIVSKFANDLRQNGEETAAVVAVEAIADQLLEYSDEIECRAVGETDA